MAKIHAHIDIQPPKQNDSDKEHKGVKLVKAPELHQGGAGSGKTPMAAPGIIDGTGHGSTWAPVKPHQPIMVQIGEPKSPTLKTELFSMPGIQVNRQIAPDGTDSVVINTGKGNDNVQVTAGPSPDTVTVTVNGEAFTLKLAPDQVLDIRTSAGNDTVTVDASVTQNTVVRGGLGNDVLTVDAPNARIDGGGGADTIRAGSGSTVYAGRGNDTVEATFPKQVSGGRGKDTITDVPLMQPTTGSSGLWSEYGLQVQEPRTRRKPTLG